MNEKEITIRFDLDKEKDRRVYDAIKKLPDYFKEADLSRAVIDFINDLVVAMSECEERRQGCEAMLSQVTDNKKWN